jgi:histidinol-phosphate/aromatic aminotransferase/cobyric acid decarboxylase-like protein
MEKFKSVRREFTGKLKKIPFLRPLDSQANYVLCEILPPFDALGLAQRLLTEHKILIRSLSAKTGFDGASYCRIAIKTEEENRRLLTALKAILK